MSKLTKREGMTRVMEWLARLPVREVGENRGFWVELIQRSDRLPGEGYAWCQSALNAALRLATGGKAVRNPPRIVGGELLAEGTASVGIALRWARKHGYIVTRPRRGDILCLYFGERADYWPDHTGVVRRVVAVLPSTYVVLTAEGNTTAAGAEAVSDPGTAGDGVYMKRRLVSRRRVSAGGQRGWFAEFYRLPGTLTQRQSDRVRSRFSA